MNAGDPTEPALRSLEAERLRPTRDETVADPWMELIHLLANPGPPDPKETARAEDQPA